MKDSLPGPAAALSKRAARRLIQRAFVLAGRARNVRQHIREAHLTILWILEDWDLEWTLVLDRGRLEFERRPAKRPDLTLKWPLAEAFFRDTEEASRAKGWPTALPDPASVETGFEFDGDLSLRKVLEPVYFAFCAALREVMTNPVDENGDPLL
jgi:hypothetical protein